MPFKVEVGPPQIAIHHAQTVFITDPINHKTFTQMRHDLLGDNFPASAVVSVSHLANPALLLEIQGVAVIG